MSICPNQCADFSMIEIKDNACEQNYREATIRSIGFYKCDTVLPNPLTAEAIKELIKPTSPSAKVGLVFSNELVNVQVGEPQTEEVKLSDSRPAKEEVVSREITFQDKIAVNIERGGKDVFADYEFWKDKKEHSTRLNYVFALSDGRIIIPRQKNSNAGMPATLNVSLNFEQKSQGGAIEVKQGKIKFLGDPFDFVQPDINLNDIPEIAGKW